MPTFYDLLWAKKTSISKKDCVDWTSRTWWLPISLKHTAKLCFFNQRNCIVNRAICGSARLLEALLWSKCGKVPTAKNPAVGWLELVLFVRNVWRINNCAKSLIAKKLIAQLATTIHLSWGIIHVQTIQTSLIGLTSIHNSNSEPIVPLWPSYSKFKKKKK